MNAKIDPADATDSTEVAAAEAADSVQTSAEGAAERAADTTAEGVGATTGEVPPMQTVYITAPQPPRRKGNRGFGTLLAVLATVAFAAAYAGLVALLILFVRPDGVESAFGAFVTGPLFYVPVLVFLVFMVLWALLANRASWWAWVVGSLVVAALVYFVSIGILLLVAGGFGLTASQAAETFTGLALNPAIIVAVVLAREVSIWFGAVIAARGRRVRERNYEAWQAFEREQAEKRAEFAGRSAV